MCKDSTKGYKGASVPIGMIKDSLNGTDIVFQ